MDIAFDRADDVLADRLGAGLGDQGPQDHQRALHGACRDQHLRDEKVALLEATADLLEGGDQGLEQDVHRAHAQAQRLFGERLDLGRMAVQRVLEQAGADLLFAAH